MSGRSVRCVIAFAAVLACGGSSSWAQDTNCRTPNCTVGVDGGGNPIRPAECRQIATPRVLRAQMNSAGLFGPHQFIPSSLRIEGATAAGSLWSYQCIEWSKTGDATIPWHSSTEDTMLSACQLSQDCLTTSNSTPPCDWETGNIDGALRFSVCHFRDQAPAIHSFQCRLHDAVGMIGTLQIVDPIRLTVSKNAAADVRLDWSAGGVGPWDVLRDATPAMPVPVDLAPGGTVLRSLTDPAFAGSGFYLVRERN